MIKLSKELVPACIANAITSYSRRTRPFCTLFSDSTFWQREKRVYSEYNNCYYEAVTSFILITPRWNALDIYANRSIRIVYSYREIWNPLLNLYEYMSITNIIPRSTLQISVTTCRTVNYIVFVAEYVTHFENIRYQMVFIQASVLQFKKKKKS